MTRAKINTILDIILLLVLIPIFFIKGSIHHTLAYILAGMVALHIILHWRQFMAMYCKLIPSLWYRWAVSAVLVILIAAAFIIPGYLPHNGPGADGFHGRSGQFQNRGSGQTRN